MALSVKVFLNILCVGQSRISALHLALKIKVVIVTKEKLAKRRSEPATLTTHEVRTLQRARIATAFTLTEPNLKRRLSYIHEPD